MQKLTSRLVSRSFILRLIVFGVLANGLVIVTSGLAEVISERNGLFSSLVSNVPLLLGLTLVYLATLLNRRKRAAWLVVLPVYGCIFGFNVAQATFWAPQQHIPLLAVVRNILLPAVVTYGLWRFRDEFRVKSDIQNLALALRASLLLLAVALAYGVAGFMLLDMRDFHQEINLWEAVHRTVDQFNFTHNQGLVGYTARAKLFMDSLSIISTGAAAYIFLSLFQPLRSRLTDQSLKRQTMEKLVRTYPVTSEDFFKLWPHDKQYYFNWPHTAGLAYHVQGGVALVVGDPSGKPADFPLLMRQFLEFCRVNDWLPAFIHTESSNNAFYESHGFALQKIGEEAILDIGRFVDETAETKYFRQITNKFIKQGYYTEILKPPHAPALIGRLKDISDQWLKLPGKVERGLMMGYFNEAYMQQCDILVLRDAASTIQAFVNQVPHYGGTEANYDLLRQSKDAPTNSNDFILVNFIRHLHDASFKTINLGLCPLAGLGNTDQDRTLIDNSLRFVYANGDRFYSFSGLRRFKAKYEPYWHSRYIAYRGGIRGFTRTINSLNKAMNKIK